MERGESMRGIVILAAVVIAVLGAGFLFMLGVIAVAVSEVADWQRWNDNDDRKEVKHHDTKT